MSKILTLAATGLAGVVLGAGIGVAAADDTSPATVDRSPEAPTMDMGSMDMDSMDMDSMDMGSMDEMHAAMRGEMPAGMAEQCDEMHAAMHDAMAEHMASQDGDATASPDGGGAAEEHEQHHPAEEED